jgi:hypothetical protein
MSAILNIYLRTDRDFAESITQYSTYCNGSGATSPFTGAEYIAQIRPSQNSATLTLALVVDDSQKASGVLNISATAASLASIATGTYYWDLLEVDSTGQKIQLVEGQAFISGTVSREA